MVEKEGYGVRNGRSRTKTSELVISELYDRFVHIIVDYSPPSPSFLHCRHPRLTARRMLATFGIISSVEEFWALWTRLTLCFLLSH